MFTCELINNIFINKIFNLDCYKIEKIDNDSLDYFKNIKIAYFQEEFALLKDNEITLWNENNFNYKYLYKEFNDINLNNNDMELIEILMEKDFFKFYMLKSELIICNFSSVNLFESILFKEKLRNSIDIVEKEDFSINNLNQLFNNSNKITIDLFNINITNLTIEIDKRNYLLMLLFKYLIIHQNKNGWLIIKINNFDKDIFLREYIYLLSSLFLDSSIVRPSIMNCFVNDMFFVGKNFFINNNHKLHYLNETINLLNVNKNHSIDPANSLLIDPLPIIYLDKIKELRMIIGQANMEHMEHLLSNLKNKNKEEKLSSLEYINKSKCEFWIEKYLSV